MFKHWLSIWKVFRPLNFFPRYVAVWCWNKNNNNFTQQSTLTIRWWQKMFLFCKFKNEKKKPWDTTLPYTQNIQSLCYLTWNLAQLFSPDHHWDVPPPWLEHTCGEFSWLNMIWKNRHLSFPSKNLSMEEEVTACRAQGKDFVEAGIRSCFCVL